MKKRLVIYPYDEELNSVLRYQHLLVDYEVVGLVSPKGRGIEGKDVGVLDGGSPLGLTVSQDFSDKLESCDAVLLPDAELELDFDELVLPQIKEAISKGKELICTRELPEEQGKELKELCQQNETQFTHYIHQHHQYRELRETIMPIHTPVIFVLGLSEKTNKFDLQLALRDQLTKMGYRVSQIGSRNYCELLGFHSIPDFLFDSLPAPQKIALFNRYVKQIERDEEPDLIIIGIPGGVMPFNDKFTNRFGITAYEISHAVRPDAAVLSLLYEDFKPEYFEKINELINMRLGFEIDCFNLATTQLDWYVSNEENKLVYVTLDHRFIQRKIENLQEVTQPLFSILTPGEGQRVAKFLVDQLASYAEVEFL